MSKFPIILSVAALAAASSGPLRAEEKADAADKAPATQATSKAAEVLADLKDPIAVVDGEKITRQEIETIFNAALQQRGIDPSQLPPEYKLAFYREIVDSLINEKLVSKAAADVKIAPEKVDGEITKIKAQFPSEEEFKKGLEEEGVTEERLRADITKVLQQQGWIEEKIGVKGVVKEDEAKAFYEADENKDKFQQPETVKASHILFKLDPDADQAAQDKQLAAAKKAVERAKKEDFAQLAKELSDDPGSKENGGDLDYFAKEEMVPEFADKAFSLKVGDVSDPVKTQFGYHIIKVTDKKPARTVPYDEVKANIIRFLEQEKKQQAAAEVVKGLRDSAKVENNLPPES